MPLISDSYQHRVRFVMDGRNKMIGLIVTIVPADVMHLLSWAGTMVPNNGTTRT
jgi:hypothetical protein